MLLRSLLVCLVLAVNALEPMPTAPTNDGQVLGMNPTLNQRAALPYTDLVRTTRGWTLVAETGTPPLASTEVLAVDAHGWPSSLPEGRDARLELTSGSAAVLVGERLLVLWRGTGGFTDGVLLASQGTVETLADADGWHRAFITPISTKALQLTLKHIADPDDRIRDLHVIRDGYHDTWTTAWFHHEFLAVNRSVRVLRFLSGCDPMLMASRAGIKPYEGGLLEPHHFKSIDEPFWGGEQIPLEALLELSNRLDADPWLPLPPQCSDASIRMVADLCASRLAPHLRPYIEFGNEVWNAGGVYSTGYWYARWLGMRYLGLTDADMADWTVATRARIVGQSQRSLEWWDIFDAAYGTTGSLDKPFRRILSTQSAVLSYNAFYQEWWDAAAAARGLTPAQLVDGYAIAPYFSWILGPRLKGTAFNHGNPDWRTVESTWSDTALIDYIGTVVLPGIRDKIIAQRADLAARGPGIPLICYEGGASIRITGDDLLRSATSYTQAGLTAAEAQALLAQLYRLADRLIVVNRDQAMYGFYQRYLSDWHEVGGGRLMCMLCDLQPAGRNGSFGMLEGIAQFRDDTAMPAWKYRGWIDWANDPAHRADDAPPTAEVVLPAVYAGLAAQVTFTVADDGRSGLPVLASWRSPDASLVVAGGTGLARTATLRAATAGDYELELVLDDGVRRSRIPVPVRVLPEPHAPVITTAPSATPSPVVLPDAATLSVEVTDADGDAVRCTWIVMDGPGEVAFAANGTVASATTIATFAVPGLYRLGVTADDDGPLGPAVAEVVVTVHPVPTCTVQVQAVDAVASEPNAAVSHGSGRIRIQRTGSSADAITVPLAIGGTAMPGADYQALSQAITLPAGATSAFLTVTALTDAETDDAETVVVAALAGPGWAAAGAPATVVIRDAGPQVVSVTALDAQAAEPNSQPALGNGSWRIRRTGSLGLPLVVRHTLAGTAQAGADFAALSGEVILPAGRATVDVVVRPLTDAADEDDETAVLTLAEDAAYAILAERASAEVLVADADYGVPTISVVAIDALASEPGAEPDHGTARLRLSRTGSLHATLEVAYLLSGSATNGVDVAPLSGLFRLPVGKASVDLVVTPRSDAQDEGDEHLTLDLAPTDTTVIDPQAGAATITVTDGQPIANG